MHCAARMGACGSDTCVCSIHCNGLVVKGECRAGSQEGTGVMQVQGALMYAYAGCVLCMMAPFPVSCHRVGYGEHEHMRAQHRKCHCVRGC